MKERTRKDLDPYKSTKQCFSKNRKTTKPYKGCLECGDNDNGYCLYYNKWCSLCSYQCDPKGQANLYHYKDTYGKWHHIKY